MPASCTEQSVMSTNLRLESLFSKHGRVRKRADRAQRNNWKQRRLRLRCAWARMTRRKKRCGLAGPT